MSIDRKEIDFKGGVVTDDTLFITDLDDSVDYIDEDLLLVEYKNNYSVDVSFHEGLNNLSVNVIFESDWEHPVYRKVIALNGKKELLESIKEAIDIAVKA
ncbi:MULTISPECIES: hypothetical protein [Serratia]|uniref:Uncharacterized protein n=1 Tax=Serratia liquefaciens TaxID=614 RepID=A0A515CTC9_SERLI|nr:MULTISPECIES: hypothetical protein [Serratia]MBI6162859.1 hypothetical protein [Serratia liquefaciens]MCS4317650.1 SpoU rRNA methylase family enzyme [Serratia sp. BIGb0234]QDL31350.1 hypothetical protein EGO53_05945 [Serratia liquefaciens]QNQ52888.1 hypothetical protein IAI46_16805 [Serratia liquefaciens]RYM77990.1 hypothetical protein BSR00_02435 [Serratia liquefaciens]